MIVLGLDPGLGTTGWGVIRADGNRLSHLANGQLRTNAKEPLARRLAHLDTMLAAVLADHVPAAAAVEEVFVNANPQSTLKLVHARGVALLALARTGIDPGEYAPTRVKQAVVGTGRADKAQVHAMILRLLPGCAPAGPDAADALAVAICHAHHLARCAGQVLTNEASVAISIRTIRSSRGRSSRNPLSGTSPAQ